MAEELYDVVVVEDVMVAMRDGVRLATDLYFPARDGVRVGKKLPAVFHRTPYDKSDVERNGGYGRFFAQRGYVAVYQDCRGTFRSEGDVDFLVPEAEDGYDALMWIDEQPWSDGKVGSWGTSWSGWTQTAMAALGPGNLVAMVPNMSGADAHESSVRQGGGAGVAFFGVGVLAFGGQYAGKAQSRSGGRWGVESGRAEFCRLARADADPQRTDPAQGGTAI
ncbi:MAG: CocE/NonD family hydrolase [Candidatus Latescibacterota bacterium]|nr:CocE/NonD family hydrolase [Candidatus Latescibacterota bacterium]